MTRRIQDLLDALNTEHKMNLELRNYGDNDDFAVVSLNDFAEETFVIEGTQEQVHAWASGARTKPEEWKMTFKSETAMCACGTIYAESGADGNTNACPDCKSPSRVCRDWMFTEVQWEANEVMAAANFVYRLQQQIHAPGDGRLLDTRKMKAAVRAGEVVLDEGLTVPDVIAAICAREE